MPGPPPPPSLNSATINSAVKPKQGGPLFSTTGGGLDITFEFHEQATVVGEIKLITIIKQVFLL